MTWALIDDEMTFNAKVVEAGNGAFGAWVRLLCWTRRSKTNGQLPTAIVKSVASKSEIERLVRTKLLDLVDGGYAIHDYLDHNLSAEALAERRQDQASARSEKARRAARARWGDRQGELAFDASEHAPSMLGASPEHMLGTVRASVSDAQGCPADPPLPPLPPAGSLSEPLVPPISPGGVPGGAAASISEQVQGELRRSQKTRGFATREWADELCGIAGAVRPSDLVAAIRKCVVGAQDGLTEQALKQRITGFVAKARTIEGVDSARERGAGRRAPAEVQRAPGWEAVEAKQREEFEAEQARARQDPNYQEPRF